MWTTAFRPATAQGLRTCTNFLPANRLGQASSRAGVVGRSFLVASSYKTSVAFRGLATATKTVTKTATKTATKAKKPAAKTNPVKKAIAGTKTKAAAKKPAAKKPAAKKPALKKKPAAKKPAVKKRKAAAKKPVVKKKPKKPSPEALKRSEKRELKAKSLIGKEPGALAPTAYICYMQPALKGKHGGVVEVRQLMKDTAVAYKALSPAELEALQATATKNVLANKAAYKAWVETHSPTEIFEANKARVRLNKYFGVKAHRAIQDDRLPSRHVGAFAMFNKSRWGSGEFAGTNVKVPEVSKKIASEWKTLPAAEKKHWMDLGHADVERYQKEMKKVVPSRA